ncbi:MAG: PH domain-containing protein [Gemmatales bacterium]|nr:PH domain-containing protein [Gemmatales bacterium]MDW8387289.1 PH domain-containing protein [Gemmatales bacterium]
MRTQPVMGIVPPSVAEARIAERWPTVAAYPFVSKPAAALQTLAKGLIVSILKLHWLLAAILMIFVLPLSFLIALAAWLMLAPFFFAKILPGFMTRYVLTNKRLMVQRGWSRRIVKEVPLTEMDKVQVVAGSEQPFYTSADLEILSNGKVLLRLPGVDEYEQFRVQIENAYIAWGRKEQPKEQQFPAKAS